MYGSLHALEALLCFVLGTILGSFLNVVIARLPEGGSLTYPPSRCPDCGNNIKFYDNIPIISFFLLKGRCRSCGGRIALRYPIIEFLAGFLSMALYLRFGLTPTFGVFLIFCAAMCAIFLIDLEHMIIPDVISLNGIAVGLVVSTVGLLPHMDWKSSLVGAITGAAVLYLPALVYQKIRGSEGLGGGDIKLLAMIGAFNGLEGVLFVIFFSSLAGSITGIFSIIFRGSESTSPIPFGPFLTTSAVLYVFAGRRIVDHFYMLSDYL
ncbi:MAG: Prepilin leader peptidase/N-methyltransferase [Thermodesulfobacteriota bacterium]|nr:Prepilin leader peptidase/N-methyltransferase [Thermodesulfobacteriota bacterium]